MKTFMSYLFHTSLSKATDYPILMWIIIRRAGNGSDSIQCRSELQNCNGPLIGSWYFPDGSTVGSPDITQSRGTMKADLCHRNNANRNMLL